MMLRRLTKLSKIEFGYHRGKVVGEIMTHPNGKSYMTWLYFNASHIDLHPDIIEELNINHVIMKPGTAPEVFEEHYQDKNFRLKKHDFQVKPGLLHMIPNKETRMSKSLAASKNRERAPNYRTRNL